VHDEEFWTARFEEHRPRLRAIAYRMLGSLAEAEDAVQETWLRMARAGADDVENLGGWLTTIVSRQCLTALRSRATRREDPLDVRLPDPVVDRAGADPAELSALADTAGLALLVVLDALGPAERLAFVLHDVFAVPFDEIAPLVGRTPGAARQLASRARRRVRGSTAGGRPDRTRHGAVVDAWIAASRRGDLAGLVALLDPDVVLRVDTGGAGSVLVRGADAVAGRALTYRGATDVRTALVNGVPGIVSSVGGRTVAVLALTVVDGRIVEIDVLNDPARLDRLVPPV
jgi:RNA polymerase sigma-70 factor (ECF subfamily)